MKKIKLLFLCLAILSSNYTFSQERNNESYSIKNKNNRTYSFQIMDKERLVNDVYIEVIKNISNEIIQNNIKAFTLCRLNEKMNTYDILFAGSFESPNLLWENLEIFFDSNPLSGTNIFTFYGDNGVMLFSYTIIFP